MSESLKGPTGPSASSTTRSPSGQNDPAAPATSQGQYPDPVMDLKNTFITIDGVKHQVDDLLRLVANHFK